MRVDVATDIRSLNDRAALENRGIFERHRLYVINLLSSPGAGKTTLLERTLASLRDEVRIGVIEGDIATDRDARRLEALDVPVIQINTDGGCHLDGRMVRRGMESLPLGELDLLVVENVGNLVCPAGFSIGEDVKVMLLSVTEGDDKPLKYPFIFLESSLLLINKVDLLPFVDFDTERAAAEARSLNPELEIFTVSCTSGEGLPGWYDWIRSACTSSSE